MNKKLLAIAIAGAMTAPMSAQAVKYKLSGQVNRAVSLLDDGNKSDIRSTDNGASNTRFRMRGSEDLGNGMNVGMYIELSVNSSPSSKATPDAGGDADGAIGTRQANVWFSGNWGKLTLGHHSEASDGASGANLSGATLTHAGSARNDNSAGLVWQGKGTTANFSTQGGTYSNLDGGRRDVIRYDTPKLGPIGLAASVGNDQSWAAGARLNTAVGGGQLSGALGYSTSTGGPNTTTAAIPAEFATAAMVDQTILAVPASTTIDDGNDYTFGGSLSYLFSQGTSIGGHYAKREKESGRDMNSWSVNLGHKWGPHAIAATYSEGSDIAANGYDTDGYAIEYVHQLKKANTSLYAGYLHSTLDGPAGTSYEDQDVFTVGALVKFD